MRTTVNGRAARVSHRCENISRLGCLTEHDAPLCLLSPARGAGIVARRRKRRIDQLWKQINQAAEICMNDLNPHLQRQTKTVSHTSVIIHQSQDCRTLIRQEHLLDPPVRTKRLEDDPTKLFIQLPSEKAVDDFRHTNHDRYDDG